jgi:hypothetical protein
MSAKPTGVLVIAILSFINGAAVLAGALWMMMAALDTTRIPFVGADIAKYMLVGALVLTGFGAAYLTTGWGLWRLRQWAQAAAIALASLALLGDVVSVLLLSSGGSTVSVQAYAIVALYAAVSVSIIVYLLQRDTTASFVGSGRPMPVERMCANCGKAGILPGMAVCPFCRYSTAPTVRPSAANTVETAWSTTASRSHRNVASTMLAPRQADVAGWLIVKSGDDAGRRVDLTDDADIGRDAKCLVCVKDEYVSREHARVKLEDGQFFIYDVGSRGGTFVNGRQTQRHMLYDGAEIRVGNTTLEFKRTGAR